MKRASRGFTLVELLVVMTLLSLLMLGMAGAVRGMGQTGERIDVRLERSDEMRTTAVFLRDVLDRVSARRLDNVPAGGNNFPFAASAQELVWMGVMPARFGTGGRHLFKLALEPGEAGQADLVVRFIPVAKVSMPLNWAQAESRVLKKDVQGFAMQFQDTRAPDTPWRDDWTIKDRHPGAVRLVLAARSGVWPDLVLPLRVLPGLDDGSALFVTGGAL